MRRGVRFSQLIRLLAAGWLSFRVAAPRLSPATTWGPSPSAKAVDAGQACETQGMLTLAGVSMASGMSCHWPEANVASRTQAM
jgi:hypothetical protein